MKAYAYLRVSSKSQLEGDGLGRQRDTISAYAAAHNIQIVKWFEEEGVSGTKNVADRPALQALMLALHSNGVRTVLIEKLDRLARDLMIQETILAYFKTNHFAMVSVMEPDMCSDDASRKLMRQVFGAFAEYERTMIVLRLRAGLNKMRACGRREGRKPYPDANRPQEREIYSRMKELHSSGFNYEQIAAALNRERIETRSSGRWYAATVRRILLR